MSEAISPKISVVMSVYNGERYLREAIDSILNQTFTDFEFIIIDDGSTDSSVEIVQGYDDGRIRLVRQENAGLAAALNKGIELARGQYVSRMDADDISLLGRLMAQFDYMNAHSNIDILGGHAYLIDEHGVCFGDKKKPVNGSVISQAIKYACPLIHPTYMVKTSIYREMNGYRADLLAGQDYDFLLRSYDMGKKLANINEYVLSYRVSKECCRPDRDRYQMFVTRVALQLHRQRVKYGHERDTTLAKITAYPRGVSFRFSLANKWRNILMMYSKECHVFVSLPIMLAVILVSLLDYELFCSSLRGLLYKKASAGR